MYTKTRFLANFDITQRNILKLSARFRFGLFFRMDWTIKADMSFAKRFFHVFALIAALMQVSAHLTPVLASIAGIEQITICSGYSSRTISIDKYGQEVPKTPESLKRNCAVCALTHAAVIDPQITLIAPEKLTIIRIDLDADTFVFASETLRAHQTRGPPTLS